MTGITDYAGNVVSDKAGYLILVAPDSRIDFKAGSMEGLYLMDLNPEEARRAQADCCWFEHDLLPR